MNIYSVVVGERRYSYLPVPPRADQALKTEGRRLVLRHDRVNTHLTIADAEQSTSGWVVGTNVLDDED